MLDKERFSNAVRALAAPHAETCVGHMIAEMELLSRFGIDTPLKAAHFLSQCAQEAGGFKLVPENLRYSSTDRLHKVWPKRFPDEASALPYVNQPEKLANLVYANRLGNSGPESGDGYRYRGRGLIQITGKDNYSGVGHVIGHDLVADPDLALRPELALLVACGTWQHIGVSRLAETDSVETYTHRVNGGLHGLDGRQKYFEKARHELVA